MRKLKALFAVGVVVALAIGCSTTKQKEDMLTAAGFKMVPADTAQKLAHLNSLPPGKITTVQRDGTLYFTYPDAANKMLYVGQQAQYDEYQNLRLRKQMADEQMNAAAMYESAPWGVWGVWR